MELESGVAVVAGARTGQVFGARFNGRLRHSHRRHSHASHFRFGIGEEGIVIELNDGSSFSCLELVKNVIETWEEFFRLRGL
jgi:hypothetical protein